MTIHIVILRAVGPKNLLVDPSPTVQDDGKGVAQDDKWENSAQRTRFLFTVIVRERSDPKQSREDNIV